MLVFSLKLHDSYAFFSQFKLLLGSRHSNIDNISKQIEKEIKNMNPAIQTIFTKKILGTLFILLSAGVIVFTTSSIAHAAFINTQNNVVLDGVVTAVGANTVTVDTDGTPPITFNTTSHTIINGTLTPGQHVRVIAHNQTAQTIQIKTTYGAGISPVITINGVVTAKTANSFTINTGTTSVTYQVTGNTHFIRTTFASLAVGNNLIIIGSDNGTNFLAREVIKR
jgi:hypothetical protein